jgi:putative transposase
MMISRSLNAYRSKRPAPTALINRIKDIAAARVRYGYQRIHVLLRREGWMINHKRVYRLYKQEGLSLYQRRPKRHRSAIQRQPLRVAQRINECWAMDFVSDQLYDGRKLRALTVLDAYTRESLTIWVDQAIRGDDVVAVLDRIRVERVLPQRISVDNGPEFISKALDRWAYEHQVELHFSRPGKPTDNAYIEAFNGRLREECLNQHWFLSLADAREKIEAWRVAYNQSRPHGALQWMTPSEFARRASLDGQSDQQKNAKNSTSQAY